MSRKPNLKKALVSDILLLIFTVIVCVLIFGFILKLLIQSDLSNGTRECNIKNNWVSMSCIILASLAMSYWYYLKGKSIKALNDLLLFFSAAVASYFYIMDHETYLEYHDNSMLCKNMTYMGWQIFILTCSFSKAFIASIEFIQERSFLINTSVIKCNHSDKELFFYKLASSLIEILRKKG
ncbi:hypothetical protein [Pectobacterium parmentieri]|uniref:hypothetical protein n=1 Tax=Pectobacterium parmentieri TaxID=1905730 RepID=UPI00051A36AF|nr:hypothetical protein [Pectobacterium parmentieri]AOR59342.1 hypothetical protein A8F97_10540 [Pectobacterium parmentieri]